MGGEFTLGGAFDVYKLECWEVESPGNWIQNNIIDVGENFFLRVYFKGSGTTWDNVVEPMTLQYTVNFYAEGMGPGVPNVAIGPPINGNLVVGQGDYQVNSTEIAIGNTGIYRCGVTVTFAAWKGLLGFNEDCVIQVNPMEE